jgi:enterobactin synthetase component D / holo-[acyl-carrier protein] synthase
MSLFPYLSQLLREREIYFVGTHDLQPITQLYAEEQKTISSACEQRQQEYATGRWCAREALRALDRPDQTILRGKEDEPLWPKGICGSIAHTHGAYCAAVASQKEYDSLGVDIEAKKRSISTGAMNVIANKDELDWLDQVGEERASMEKLIFCAKESIFKCLYPLVNKRFSFSVFSVLRPLETGDFSLVLNEPLHPDFRPGHRFPGMYFTNSEWMVTLSYLIPKHKQIR